MDKIIIKSLRIKAFHGVNPEEKENGQMFELDISALLDAKSARLSDDLDDTVSYAKMLKKAVAVFTAEKYDLLECAGDKVAEALLESFAKLQSVTVLVKKPEAPIKADFDYVALELTLTRDEYNKRVKQ